MTDLDIRLFRSLHAALSGSEHLVALMAALTIIGGGWGALSIPPLLFPARTRRFALMWIATIALNTTLVYFIKIAIHRPRPWVVMPDIQPLVFPGPTDFSFPSGHSAGAFCYATFVAVVLWRTRKGFVPRSLAVVLVIFAVGIALSRIALGVHFPGDVTAGAIIGATSGTIGANIYLKRFHHLPTIVTPETPAE